MNLSIAEKLPEIFSLARQRTEQSRVRLAGILADVFLSDGSLNEREQILVNEIIDELIGNASAQVKQMLAERLAFSSQVPHRVLLSLACDSNISVAHSVLHSSPQLKDEDLIFVVEAYGTEHALAISERKTISEAVVDALITTGEVDVMISVAANLGASISPSAMGVLVETARFAKKLHAPLIQRPELSLEMGEKLFWWLETELRRVVAKRFGINPGQIDQALEATINDLLSSIETDSGDDFAMQKIVDWLEERDAVTPRVMIQSLRMGFFKLFNMMISRKLDLGLDLVNLMVAEDGGRSVSVLCRAADIDKPSFVSIFLLSRGSRPGEQIVNPRELSTALVAFDKLNTATARTLIDQWRKDPSYILGRLKQAVY